MILCSIGVKKHIAVIEIQRSGKEIAHKVYKTNVQLQTSNYAELLDTISKGMIMLRNLITSKEQVLIELSNGTVALWFEQGYSKPAYEKYFKTAYMNLHRVPMTYNIIVTKTPVAFKFANQKYLDKPLIYKGFSDIIEDEEENPLEISSEVKVDKSSDNLYRASDLNPSLVYGDDTVKAEFEDDELDFGSSEGKDKNA